MLLETFLATGLVLATPILLAALGELLVERSGVLNIGVEGVMLSGAFAAALAAWGSHSTTAGVLAAALTGTALALLFALATVRLGADQIVVGAALNLVALGVTGALYRAALGASGTALVLPTLAPLDVPLLRHAPILGKALFGQNALVYLGLCLTPLLAVLLRHTGLGLRLRALGDHPQAAASLGLPVRRDRILMLAVGGALAGLGGAALTLAATNTFVEGITAGRGFIALAVVVFGRWSAWGALGGALLFGLASALQFQFQAAALAIPYQLFLMLPYVLTLAVLLLPSGGGSAPRALGTRYDRE
ncbi:ABC transporter permease [Candidatus Binatia bacterium]|jgi:simple sugar transport system permease protein|nr:ABC transporter permease [Candidatus Binatia bacterium]